MAGDWIKLDHTTPGKPEIFQMADLLNLDEDTIIGKLARFWIWADQNTTGDSLPLTTGRIDRMLHCDGFAAALLSVGWLAEDAEHEGRLHIPNFEFHNGETGKARAKNNRRVAKHRAGLTEGRTDRIRKFREERGSGETVAAPEQTPEENAEGNNDAVESAPQRIAGLVLRNAGLTPEPLLGPLQKALPEERREEKNREEEDSLRSSSSNARSGTASPVDWSEQQGWKIGEDLLKSWEEAFPACDLPQSLAASHAWLVANPHRRKKDYLKFLNGWLQGEQKRRSDMIAVARGALGVKLLADRAAGNPDAAGHFQPPECRTGARDESGQSLTQALTQRIDSTLPLSPAPRPESTWSLRTRLDAAKDLMERIKANPKNWHHPPGQPERSILPTVKSELRQIRANMDRWERQLAAVA